MCILHAHVNTSTVHTPPAHPTPGSIVVRESEVGGPLLPADVGATVLGDTCGHPRSVAAIADSLAVAAARSQHPSALFSLRGKGASPRACRRRSEGGGTGIAVELRIRKRSGKAATLYVFSSTRGGAAGCEDVYNLARRRLAVGRDAVKLGVPAASARAGERHRSMRATASAASRRDNW